MGRRPKAIADENGEVPPRDTRFHPPHICSHLLTISKAAFHPVCDTNWDNNSLLGELLGAKAWAPKLGVSCASAQTFAAERRFTLTGVNDFSAIHTPFPCSL